MLAFLESGMGAYAILAAGLLGFISSLLAAHGYKRTLKQIDRMEKTKNPFLTGLKKKIESTRKNKEEIRNLHSFLERQTFGCRILGIRNELLESFSFRMAGISLLLGGVLAFFSYSMHWPTETITFYGAAGVLAAVVLWVQAGLIDFKDKRRRLTLYLEDYFENTYVIEETNKEALEQEKLKRRKEIDYLKQSLDRIAAGRETPPEVEEIKQEFHFTKEEEEVLEEIFKEYFA